MLNPAPFPKVLEQEHEQVRARRAHLGVLHSTEWQDMPAITPDQEMNKCAIEAHSLRPFGVCISGGGIRSATFGLGILQGLAERGLLPFIDYLSTVSGGGYIGTWLHAVIRRKCGGDPREAAKLISPTEDHQGLHYPKVPKGPCNDPVTFLREYSNYLAPHLGLFSPDFWMIGIIWLRNMFLNQLILVPFLAGVVLVAIHAGFVHQQLAQTGAVGWLAVGVTTILSLACAVAIMNRNLRTIVKREFSRPPTQPPERRRNFGPEKFWLIWMCVALVLLSALTVGTSNYDPIPNGLTNVFHSEWYQVPLLFLALLGLYLFLQLGGGFNQCFKKQHAKWGNYWWLHLWIPVACAVATTILLSKVLHWITTWQGCPSAAWHTIAWGPPLVVQVLLVGVTVQIGLMGADFPDSSREWLARLGALLTIAFSAWMALFAIGIFGPKWLISLAVNYGKTAAGALTGWIATTAAGVYAGRSPRTGDHGENIDTGKVLEWIGKIAPTVFLIGYLLTVSLVLHEIIAHEGGVYATAKPDANAPSGWLAPLAGMDRLYWAAYDYTPAITPPGLEPRSVAILLFLCCSALVLVLPLRININEFSLHHFYKNRLVRCYLGASRAEVREPNPFTGFDSHDDLAIGELLAKPPHEKPGEGPYWGPYPIVNTTLNLNTGSDLATQERKGASFIFSALRCGFDLPPSAEDKCTGREAERHPAGYRNTRGYMHPGGPAIGTAMAISGAAANPNGGYHTSGSLSFLMTIFDVRLGWWVGNPRLTSPSERPGPRYALCSLLSELFAQTTNQSHYLNLSDGGHFDNLGLYELVKRRCRYIIVCDGEEDSKLNFESLGGAIRKCRADFGVEIDLDPKQIQRDKEFSRSHCVVGTVTYPEITEDQEHPCGGPARRVTGPTKGWILYLKASLTSDEPEDVRQYQAAHSVFPHEPTTNQFFTESQFESYRRLGWHAVESAFESADEQLAAVRAQKSHDSMSALFRGLCQQWYPPSNIAEGLATRHTEAYSALMKRLTDDPDLRYLDRQIIPHFGENGADATPDTPAEPDWVTEEIRRKAFFFCLDLIQLMENVWSDLRLFNRADRENPKNGGWMREFRHWASQPLFQGTWHHAQHTYNDLFRQFFRGLSE